MIGDIVQLHPRFLRLSVAVQCIVSVGAPKKRPWDPLGQVEIATEMPGWNRCQHPGSSVEESCGHGEVCRREAVNGRAGGKRSPSPLDLKGVIKPRLLDVELQNLEFALLAFVLVLPSFSLVCLISPC